jgi:methyl-accepting chemotaxis protein
MAAHEVIDKQNYSHRVVKRSDDEVGVLVDAFNQMLTQIQERETTLQATNLTLRSQITRHKAARDEIAALEPESGKARCRAHRGAGSVEQGARIVFLFRVP